MQLQPGARVLDVGSVCVGSPASLDSERDCCSELNAVFAFLQQAILRKGRALEPFKAKGEAMCRAPDT
jgi:hypothetical protein